MTIKAVTKPRPRFLLVLTLAAAAMPAGAHARPTAWDAVADRAFGSRSGEQLSGVLTFTHAPPTEMQLAALHALGLRAQGMKRLPMAMVRGTAAQIAAAVTQGAAIKFYPDEPITYASTASNHAISVDRLHDLGFTGRSMTVAIVDSGIDATHPDLADHVVHNVTMVDQNVQQTSPTPQTPIFVAVDEGPGSNTDRNGGHGTLVAGVLAADGTTDRSQVGVAPDAELIGYTGPGTNESVFLMAFDHILDHPEWGIDVLSNSWIRPVWDTFDPANPINVATKTLTDHGIVVVWAAGNSGAGGTEMTMNPYSVAPWNISVAGSTIAGGRIDYSSNGLVVDNSEPTGTTDGHVRFTGDRIGMYHPTLAAPAGPLASSCTEPNVVAWGCTPGSTGTADGTSFSAPHVAGLAALLRQARPGLSVAQVRETLEATAKQPTDGAPFWQVGYGVADAVAALEMVQANNFASRLRKAHAADDARVLADRDWKVSASDHWTSVPPIATAEEISPDRRDLRFTVSPGTDAVKVTMNHSLNMDYTVTVLDAGGTEIGGTSAFTTTTATVETALIDLREVPAVFGDWTLRVQESLGYSDDARDEVTVAAALLDAQERVTAPLPRFVADGAMAMAFTPVPARTTGVLSPEGCEIEPGEPVGVLAAPASGGVCHSGEWGWGLFKPAEFTSAPFEEAFVLGGTATVVAYNASPAQGPVSYGFEPWLYYWLEGITANGAVYSLGSSLATRRLVDGRNEMSFELPPGRVAGGDRLRLGMVCGTPGNTEARLLFGGPNYGDSGITLTTGHFE